MTYSEQVRKALFDYNEKYGSAYYLGMTPAMYKLIKAENEKHGLIEPKGGWRSFYGAMINVMDVSKEPLFCIGGMMYKPETPVDPEKVMAGLKCHTQSATVKGCEGCPYRGNYIDCGKRLCADAMRYIYDLKGGVDA